MLNCSMTHINENMVKFFSALSDPTRLNILLSMVEGPRTVNEIYSHIGRQKMTLSAISHQLKDMQDIGLIEFEKKGREKFFQLADRLCWCILRDALKHFHDSKNCPACQKSKKLMQVRK